MLKIKTKTPRIYFVGIIFLAVLFLYVMSLRSGAGSPWHQRMVMSVVTPFQVSYTFISRKVVSVWDHYFALVDASRQNDELKMVVDEQRGELNGLAEVESENERLRSLLEFGKRDSLNTIGAKVVANDPRGDFRVITIDKGYSEGVNIDMPVVAAAGLVGRVVDVSDNIAKVLLITDPNSAVDVLAQRSRARALLVGTLSDVGLSPHYYLSRLEYLTRKSDIVNEDIIVTSGLDGIYPSGIPVGAVADLENASNGVFKSAKVVPFVDFSNVEEVLVVKK